jgi:hypothetical protein
VVERGVVKRDTRCSERKLGTPEEGRAWGPSKEKTTQRVGESDGGNQRLMRGL